MASQAVLKAVQTARLTQTRLLMQMGSEVDGKDDEGKTTLIHALLVQDSKLRARFLRLLLKAGAVVSVGDKQETNALMWACRVATSHDVRLLLRHADEDLNLNAQNLKGQTALWIAVDGGKVETVREVLRALSKHELSSEVPDHRGITPAMRAATLCHLDCLRALIAHLDTAGKSNNTLINIAQINRILKSVSVDNEPKKTSVNHQADDPRNQTTKDVKLPTIQIISTGSYRSSTAVNSKRPQLDELNNDYALFSLELYRDLTGSSTPISFDRSAPSFNHRPLRFDQNSTIRVTINSEDPNSDHSLSTDEENTHVKRISKTTETESQEHTPNLLAPVRKISSEVRLEEEEEEAAQNAQNTDSSIPLEPVNGGSCQFDDPKPTLKSQKHCVSPPLARVKKISRTVKFEDQNYAQNPQRRSTLTPPVAGSLGPTLFQTGSHDRRGRILWKPLASVTMVRGSIRDNLHDLFDMIAQQTSVSFRKTAIKPLPRKKSSQAEVATCKGNKGGKLRTRAQRHSGVKHHTG